MLAIVERCDRRTEHDLLKAACRQLRITESPIDQDLKIAVELDRRDPARLAVVALVGERTQRDIGACRGVLEQRLDKGFELTPIGFRRRLQSLSRRLAAVRLAWRRCGLALNFKLGLTLNQKVAEQVDVWLPIGLAAVAGRNLRLRTP